MMSVTRPRLLGLGKAPHLATTSSVVQEPSGSQNTGVVIAWVLRVKRSDVTDAGWRGSQGAHNIPPEASLVRSSSLEQGFIVVGDVDNLGD